MFRLVWHPREATKMPRIAFIFLIALLPFSSSVAAKEPASKPSTQLIDDVVANEMSSFGLMVTVSPTWRHMLGPRLRLCIVSARSANSSSPPA
jgi:hypothetical protein